MVGIRKNGSARGLAEPNAVQNAAGSGKIIRRSGDRVDQRDAEVGRFGKHNDGRGGKSHVDGARAVRGRQIAIQTGASLRRNRRRLGRILRFVSALRTVTALACRGNFPRRMRRGPRLDHAAPPGRQRQNASAKNHQRSQCQGDHLFPHPNLMLEVYHIRMRVVQLATPVICPAMKILAWYETAAGRPMALTLAVRQQPRADFGSQPSLSPLPHPPLSGLISKAWTHFFNFS